MQSSANLSGEPDAAPGQREPLERAELVLDGGALPGRPSTVIDLRDFETERRWHVLREGALPREEVREVLEPLAA